jgi:hypothetical protein
MTQIFFVVGLILTEVVLSVFKILTWKRAFTDTVLIFLAYLLFQLWEKI